MHAILSSVGTDGDVFPYLALGAALHARGHRVTLAASSQYKESATERGLEFCPVISAQENYALLANPDFWHPIKGGQVAAQWGVALLPRQYAILAELAAADDAVFVSNPALFAARLASETHRRPIVTVCLQPWMIPSIVKPPVMPAGLTLPKRAPVFVGKLYFHLIGLAVDALTRRPLNEFRHRLGLEPVERVLHWWFSPQLILGMFPEWYGPRQADWPAQFRFGGFALSDARPVPLSDEIQKFCMEGEPPVVFTFGTGMMHAAEAFGAAADACAMTGMRGILLTRYDSQIPTNLPASVRHFSFAPFESLLKHCAAIVHHGGVGTSAAAMAAGIPQLVLPYSYDQFDNAERLTQLGVAASLKPAQRTASKIADALRKLDNPNIAMQCRCIAQRMKNENGLARCVEWIEELARSANSQIAM